MYILVCKVLYIIRLICYLHIYGEYVWEFYILLCECWRNKLLFVTNWFYNKLSPAANVHEGILWQRVA